MRSAAMLAVLFVASCGGTASETPWPVEPDTAALGPAGESARIGAPDDTSPAARGEVPAAEDVEIDAGRPVRKRP